MKIHILTKIKNGAWGGGNQFLSALKCEFEKMGVYIDNPDEAEVILFNSFPFGDEQQILKLYNLQKKNKVIIHRLAGPMLLARGHDLLVDKMIYLINGFFADGTIFQSKWSMRENYLLGLKKKDFETIITNAPNPEIFKKNNVFVPIEKGRKIKLIITSWSTNPNKGFEFSKFLDDRLDYVKYDLSFVGNVNYDFKNIHKLGVLSSGQLAAELPKYDIFVFTSKVEACSNALIEALHCGLPAVAFNGSSNPEIIGGTNGELFNGKEDLLEKIDKIASDLDGYKQNIRVISLSEVAKDYYKFMLDVCEKAKNKTHSNFFALSIVFVLWIFWKISNKVFLIKNKIFSYGKR